jgi:molybdenum cofactor cytidylyltransferase
MTRCFAIIPAAGNSTRMGASKLLLPLGQRTVIEHVLEAWAASAVTRTVIVVRRDDGPLLERCRRFDVDVVIADAAPADMKASIQLGLSYVQNRFRPAADEPWLAAPADSPRVSTRLIDAILAAYDPTAPSAFVPTFGGRRGHPVLLPWSWAPLVHELPPSDGLNDLLKTVPVRELPWHDGSILEAFNRPADYARLLKALNCQT